MKNNNFYSAVDNLIGKLPVDVKEHIKRKVEQLKNYEPRIGVIGKTGVGKSSLINAIFDGEECKVGAINSTTREMQTVTMDFNGHAIHFIDFPGIGESEERDKEYLELYKKEVPKLDMVLWVVKCDDKSFTSEQVFYNKVILGTRAEDKVLFVISQAEKMDPFSDWNEAQCAPGARKFENLRMLELIVPDKISNGKSKRIVTVSAEKKYNLGLLITEIIYILPKNAKYSTAMHTKKEFTTDNTYKHAEEGFVETVLSYVVEISKLLPAAIAKKALSSVNGARLKLANGAGAIDTLFSLVKFWK